MREIKFRAWDGQQMIYPDNKYNIDLCFNRVGGWCLWNTAITPHKLISGQFNKQTFELMQFVGLHDKNGKEIYEKDIIKDEEINGSIEWSIQFGGWIIQYINGEFNHLFEDRDNLEVIGNIYESPIDNNSGK